MSGWLRRIGMVAVGQISQLAYLLSVIGGALWLACQLSSWSRAVRQVMARQMLFTAIESIGLTLRMGFAVGILVMVQIELWLREVGDADLTRLFLSIFLRELGPLLANVIVIIRSGSAMATELARMRVDQELEVLESQGIDTMTYLIMPRVLAAAVSVFCLSVLLVASSFVTAYVVGSIHALTSGPFDFFAGLIGQLDIQDLLFFLPKTLLSGLLLGALACATGLEIQDRDTELPQVAGRCAVRSLTAVFVLSMLLSLTIYGRFLIYQVL
jgi:phospholipid/cholesterol/gamma-HCH transport system permease protein